MAYDDQVPDETPRWAYDASGNDTAGAVSPPGSQKQTQGWVVEKPSHNTFNWIHNLTGRWIDYLHKTVGTWFAEDCVAPGSDCEVTHVVALTFDIAAGKYWSSGAFYEASADTLVAANTVSGNARIDWVVATPSGYAIRQGTATTLPTEPSDPTLSAGDVPLASYRVETTTVSDFTDRRRHGRFVVDSLEANDRFRAGSQGGGTWSVAVDGDALTVDADTVVQNIGSQWSMSVPVYTLNTSGLATIIGADTFGITAANGLYLGNSGSGRVYLGNASGGVEVPAAGVEFPATQSLTRHYPAAFAFRGTDPAVSSSPLFDAAYEDGSTTQQDDGGNPGVCWYELRLPRGVTVTEVRMVGEVLVTDATSSIDMQVYEHSVTGGGDLNLGGSTGNNAGDAAGTAIDVALSLSEVVTGLTYRVKVTTNGGTIRHRIDGFVVTYDADGISAP
jgi:hypothetical protein